MTKPIGSLHCKSCGPEDEDLEICIADPQTLAIGCHNCEKLVGSFKLAEPLQGLVCDACGEPLTSEHTHH